MNYLYICFRLFRINPETLELEELVRAPVYTAGHDAEAAQAQAT